MAQLEQLRQLLLIEQINSSITNLSKGAVDSDLNNNINDENAADINDVNRTATNATNPIANNDCTDDFDRENLERSPKFLKKLSSLDECTFANSIKNSVLNKPLDSTLLALFPNQDASKSFLDQKLTTNPFSIDTFNSNHQNLMNKNLINQTTQSIDTFTNQFALSSQMNSVQDMDFEKLERFAKQFKQRRIKLGYTQNDVGLAMVLNFYLKFIKMYQLFR